MRCPKCGYISFDYVAVCPHCKKDISNLVSEIPGTAYSAAPRNFLNMSLEGGNESAEHDDMFDLAIDSHEGFDDKSAFAVDDPDLEVLEKNVYEDDDEATIDFNGDFQSSPEVHEEPVEQPVNFKEDFDFALDEDIVGELDRDLDELETAHHVSDDEEGGLSLDFPDELSDLSDLSPPVFNEKPGAPSEHGKKQKKATVGHQISDASDLDDFSLNLDLDLEKLDEFKLSLEDEEDEEGEIALGDLSLDDIGLADTTAQEEKKEFDIMDMDGDLDFTLDLDGLDLDKK